MYSSWVMILVFYFQVTQGGEGLTMLKVTTFSNEISPALNFSTRIL